MARIINGIDELKALVGEELGTSDWLEVTQDRIDTFADATGDHQWIHVDPERAKDGPFGTTIAHGYLTMSLGPVLLPQVVTVKGFSMALNYGLEKLRFPAPVHVLRFPVFRIGFRILSPRSWGRDHRKILAVDGSTAFVGGYNIGSLYATDWRDTHLRITGPGVVDLKGFPALEIHATRLEALSVFRTISQPFSPPA